MKNCANTLKSTKTDAERITETLFETISQILSKDDEITWPGFGRFTVTHKAARTGRNPATGKPIKIAAKAVPTFKAATQLKEHVAKKVKVKVKSKG